MAERDFSPPEHITVHSSNAGARPKMEAAIESIRRLALENPDLRGAYSAPPAVYPDDEFVERVFEIVLCASDAPGELVTPEVVAAALPVNQRRSIVMALVMLQNVWGYLKWDREGGREGVRVVGEPHDWMQKFDHAHASFEPYRAHRAALEKASADGWRAIMTKRALRDEDEEFIGGFWPGWLPIIDEALGKMIAAGWDRQLFDLKSKFCRLHLRVVGDASPQIKAIIRAAETKSGRACEYCGAPHGLKTPMSGTALCRSCDEHRQKVFAMSASDE